MAADPTSPTSVSCATATVRSSTGPSIEMTPIRLFLWSGRAPPMAILSSARIIRQVRRAASRKKYRCLRSSAGSKSRTIKGSIRRLLSLESFYPQRKNKGCSIWKGRRISSHLPYWAIPLKPTTMAGRRWVLNISQWIHKSRSSTLERYCLIRTSPTHYPQARSRCGDWRTASHRKCIRPVWFIPRYFRKCQRCRKKRHSAMHWQLNPVKRSCRHKRSGIR